MENEKAEFMELQHSESVVAQMSATIFSAFVQKTEYSSDIEDVLIEKSVAIAIKLANRAEKLIKGDEEWKGKTPGSAFLAG
jgi:hypothetical protein